MSELIAEARVLVTPDTTKFAGLLKTEVSAAIKSLPPQTVPITPIITASGAQSELLAGARAGEQSAARVTSATNTATAARAQFARTESVVAAAEQRAAVATTEAAASQIRYTAALASSAAAQKAYQIALTTTDEVLTLQAGLIVAVTKENESLALSQLTVARTAQAESAALNKAAATQAAGLGGLTKGAGSAVASLLGVRGATLAATGPFIAGAAGAIAFGKAISIATSFNSQLAVFAATTGATADEMERVSAAARQLGKDITLPGVSAGDAAESMTEFAKAGLSVNDAIAATRGGLQLATAAQLSNAEAVEITASALNAFKLSGDQAVSVADTLANAANAAQGSIGDIALGLKQASGAAAAVGVSFKDTTALLTLLARNGLTASDAGTALRTSFIRLVNPSKKAQEILKDLNVSLRDAQGNLRPEVFREFADAQRGLAASTQQANAAIVFGSDAFRVIGLLGRENAGALDQVRRSLDEQGTAARVAGARMVGLAGQTANLKNQLEALGLSAGKIATPALEAFVSEVAAFVTIANEGVTAAGELKDAIASIPGAPQGAGFFANVAKDIVKFSPSTPVGILNIAKTVKDAITTTDDELVSAGAVLRSAIEDAGREAARGAVPFSTQINSALDAAFALVQKKLRDKAKEIRAGQFTNIAGLGGGQSGLEEVFNQIVSGGGSDRQQISNLQKQAKVQADIIAEAGPNAAGNLLKARRDAQAKLASINQQIIGIEKGIAADQKAASDEQQRIRDQAKAARDRNFLQAQEDARTRQDRLVTLASDTPQLSDDIRRQEQLRVLIQRQIAGLKASAVDEQAKQQALRALRAARDATTDELKKLHASQKAQQAENARIAQEQITENLALRTQIAEARGASTSLVVQKIDAQIKDARAAQARAKKGSQEWLKATLALEELRQKRRDLLDKTKEEARDQQAGFSGFQFLQKTQGFAANLLGNLIPGFATGGLVGNTSSAAVQGQITDPRSAMLGDEVVTGSIRGDRGVRPVQVDTTNALLRQILAAVRGGPVSPPEIAFNRRWGAAGFDTM